MKITDFTIVVNMANNAAEAKKHFDRFNAIAMQFLDVRLRFGGQIPMSQRMRKAVINRVPITARKSDLPEVIAFQSLAKQVLDAPMNTTKGIRFFQQGKSGEG